MTSLQQVYLAGPLFSEAEKRYNLYLRDPLTGSGFMVYLPQEQGEDTRHRNLEEDRQLFLHHREALDRSHCIIAVCDGTDTDSGTAWEMGYAHAQGIPVIALRTDVRMLGHARRINLMLEQSASIVTTHEELIVLLKAENNIRR
ncbi:MAG: nucleoside 2-deoxyribosyltransferase [Methanomicrobiales archaeon]|nr:nucleoside 2-deoxyribosyltransferase [Methanomicrobiales archaeon]